MPLFLLAFVGGLHAQGAFWQKNPWTSSAKNTLPLSHVAPDTYLSPKEGVVQLYWCKPEGNNFKTLPLRLVPKKNELRYHLQKYGNQSTNHTNVEFNSCVTIGAFVLPVTQMYTF